MEPGVTRHRNPRFLEIGPMSTDPEANTEYAIVESGVSAVDQSGERETERMPAKTDDEELLRPGDMVGPFEVEGEIARGGFAIVYLARSPDGEKRAIKVLNGIPGKVNEQVIDRFKMEIVLLSHIDHVHVVRFYEAGAITDRRGRPMLWVALEYLEGPTLRELIHQRPGAIAHERIARWGKQIAEGLDDAHSLKVIHRDLKPENVSIVHGIAKIFDFGIAKFYEWGVKTTDHSKRFGTLPYMAPEQVDSGQVDGRTDVWALGLILHELATGRHAFLREGESFADVNGPSLMFRSLSEEAVPLTDAVPGFPQVLSDVVTKALQKKADDRFASIEAMGKALDAALRTIKDDKRAAALGDAYMHLDAPATPPPSSRRDRASAPPPQHKGSSDWKPGQKRTMMLLQGQEPQREDPQPQRDSAPYVATEALPEGYVSPAGGYPAAPAAPQTEPQAGLPQTEPHTGLPQAGVAQASPAQASPPDVVEPTERLAPAAMPVAAVAHRPTPVPNDLHDHAVAQLAEPKRGISGPLLLMLAVGTAVIGALIVVALISRSSDAPAAAATTTTAETVSAKPPVEAPVPVDAIAAAAEPTAAEALPEPSATPAAAASAVTTPTAAAKPTPPAPPGGITRPPPGETPKGTDVFDKPDF